MISNAPSSIIADDLSEFVGQLGVFNFINSAVCVLDSNHQVIFENGAFNKINLELSESPDASGQHKRLLNSEGMILSIKKGIASKAPFVYKSRFYYSRNIHVDLSIVLTPILTKEGGIQGLLCAIGEESIDFESKSLAKSQDKLSSLKSRIDILDKDAVNSNLLIKFLFKNAPVAIVLFNKDRKIVNINKQAEKLFNISASEGIGSDCTSILSCYKTYNCCPLMERKDKRIEIDGAESIEKDGNKIPLLRSAVQFNHQDEDVIIETYMDMREMEQAKMESKAKSAFLANMSHEIRTPLTAILGYSETLLDSEQSVSDRLNSINTIIRSGKHLHQLIDNILDLSKIEASGMDVESIETPVFEIVSEIAEIVMQQAKTRDVELSIVYDFPVPEQIINDPVRIKQVLINLCSNAIKFTEEGSVRIHVSYSKSSNQLVFKIIDTGIGMTQAQCDTVFGAYKQADTLTTRLYGGTGIGLYLSKQLAGLLGGDIRAESEPGKGSCFTFTVDAGDCADANFAESMPQRIADTESSQVVPEREMLKGDVLLVEDNVDNQDLISLYIHKFGGHVTIANNGKEGVELALARTFDLVLMDMQMPIMNGMDATIYLRDKGYSGPIVALTANVTKDDLNEYGLHGCSESLPKPINQKMFYQMLRRYLKLSEESGIPLKPLRSSLINDRIDLSHLVDKYIHGFHKLITQLEDALEQEDWALIKEQVHDLKSTSGNLGFIEIMTVAIQIRFEADKKDYQGVALQIEKLNTLHQRMLL